MIGIIFSDFLDIFEFQVLPERRLSQKTIIFYRQKLKYIRRVLGARLIDSIARRDISEFLLLFPPCSSNQYRGLLVDIFKHAVGMGHSEHNPAADTLKRKHRKQRLRLTIDGYRAIHGQAEPWLQNAMDLGLHTLQRLSDLCNIQILDIVNGCLCVKQQKTGKLMRIRIRGELWKVIDRCHDGIYSAFLIHRSMARLNPEYLSKAFARARDRCGYFKALPINAKPTFHEIRSLGSHLYQTQHEFPQDLLGHSSKAMTEYYLVGHERFIEVEAGLRGIA